ncbi:MAG: mannose-1-phosphate guanylyltransferase [Sulfurimonas sp.]|nr:MAG: mannose-1-phosphate guanylyltransferase [Sulfurimonas sp.]
MKAMILSAGRGERMRPLSDTLPKPLLEVRGKPLIVHHLERLAHNGFTEVIINIAHLGHMIPDTLGSGAEWGLHITYSDEQSTGALESAGGIVNALPLLGETFVVINGDIWCDYEVTPHYQLKQYLAHLILVPNPPQHLEGDFALVNGHVTNQGTQQWTFSGIGYYRRELFKNLTPAPLPLAPLLREAAANRRVSGMLYEGVWHDVGTPARLKALRS